MSNALILTLKFDSESFYTLNALRVAYFPTERNFIPAHLTLFHALPAQLLPDICAELEVLCQRSEAFKFKLSQLRSLGRGVALATSHDEKLRRLRDQLLSQWKNHLSRQDLQPFSPHVTLQNKVSAEESRALLEKLRHSKPSFEVEACGLLLWEYLGGPWKLLRDFPFQENSSSL